MFSTGAEWIAVLHAREAHRTRQRDSKRKDKYLKVLDVLDP